MHITRLARTTLVLAVLTPTPASADKLVTPFVGSVMSQTTYGVSMASMGRKAGGFEFDLGVTPDAFIKENSHSDNNLVTVMGNLIVGVPVGPIRPYARSKILSGIPAAMTRPASSRTTQSASARTSSARWDTYSIGI